MTTDREIAIAQGLAPVLDVLDAAGYDYDVHNTGGNCMVVELSYAAADGSPRTLVVTGGDTEGTFYVGDYTEAAWRETSDEPDVAAEDVDADAVVRFFGDRICWHRKRSWRYLMSPDPAPTIAARRWECPHCQATNAAGTFVCSNCERPPGREVREAHKLAWCYA